MSKRKVSDKEQDPIRYRFTESGAEWALIEGGHYRILRCGDLVPGARVRLRIRGLAHRQGYVQALLPGWGPSPRPVVAWVLLDPPASRHVKEPKPVGRYYRADQLTVIADDQRMTQTARGG